MPYDPADTTVVKLQTSTTNAPAVGDLIDIDQQAHLMYLGNGDADAIEVFDVSTPTPRWLRAFHVPGGVAGILVAPDIIKVFGGSPNGMVIVDADPNSPTYGTTLNTMFLGPGGSDELDYDPVDHKVYVTDVADQTSNPMTFPYTERSSGLQLTNCGWPQGVHRPRHAGLRTGTRHEREIPFVKSSSVRRLRARPRPYESRCA